MKKNHLGNQRANNPLTKGQGSFSNHPANLNYGKQFGPRPEFLSGGVPFNLFNQGVPFNQSSFQSETLINQSLFLNPEKQMMAQNNKMNGFLEKRTKQVQKNFEKMRKQSERRNQQMIMKMMAQNNKMNKFYEKMTKKTSDNFVRMRKWHQQRMEKMMMNNHFQIVKSKKQNTNKLNKPSGFLQRQKIFFALKQDKQSQNHLQKYIKRDPSSGKIIINNPDQINLPSQLNYLQTKVNGNVLEKDKYKDNHNYPTTKDATQKNKYQTQTKESETDENTRESISYIKKKLEQIDDDETKERRNYWKQECDNQTMHSSKLTRANSYEVKANSHIIYQTKICLAFPGESLISKYKNINQIFLSESNITAPQRQKYDGESGEPEQQQSSEDSPITASIIMRDLDFSSSSNIVRNFSGVEVRDQRTIINDKIQSQSEQQLIKKQEVNPNQKYRLVVDEMSHQSEQERFQEAIKLAEK